ncbi:MAG: helix-turn-helix transcriptional regulator [Vicinamibacteraceae bacterium]
MSINSPVGSTTQQAQRRRARASAAYRAEQRRLAPFEEVARLVIKQRAALGISQQELARRVGTSHSAISRLESGRHKTSVETLQRVAEALGVRLVLGFESRSEDAPMRELVSI